MDDNQPQQPEQKPKQNAQPNPLIPSEPLNAVVKRGTRKKLYIVGGIVLLLVAAGAAFLLFNKNNSNSTGNAPVAAEKSVAAPNVKTYSPFAVAYAFGDPAKEASHLYLR